MKPRFEVHLNSKKICTAGLEPDVQGLLSVLVELVQGTPQGDQTDLFIQGNLNDGSDWVWGLEKLRVGDEIVIKLLPPGDIDEPNLLGEFAKKKK